MIVYSNNCPKCNALKHKLQQNNILFTESNDMNELTNKCESMGLSSDDITLPMVDVGLKDLLDFNESLKYINDIKSKKENK